MVADGSKTMLDDAATDETPLEIDGAKDEIPLEIVGAG